MKMAHLVTVTMAPNGHYVVDYFLKGTLVKRQTVAGEKNGRYTINKAGYKIRARWPRTPGDRTHIDIKYPAKWFWGEFDKKLKIIKELI